MTSGDELKVNESDQKCVEKVSKAKFIKIIDKFNELIEYCDEDTKRIRSKVLSLYDNDEANEELKDPYQDNRSVVVQLDNITYWLEKHYSELVDIRQRLEEIV